MTIGKNTTVSVSLIFMAVSALGGGLWKVAQAVVRVDEQAAKVERLENGIERVNENLTRMGNDLSYMRGYYERQERKKSR